MNDEKNEDIKVQIKSKHLLKKFTYTSISWKVINTKNQDRYEYIRMYRIIF